MIGFDSSAERRGFWRGVACGLVMAGVVASCMAPPKARADPVASARANDGASITLHDERGHCDEGELVAVWQSPDRSRAVLGCWHVGEDRLVHIAYSDGDIGRVPRRALWWWV